jgi:hypothetical protein
LFVNGTRKLLRLRVSTNLLVYRKIAKLRGGVGAAENTGDAFFRAYWAALGATCVDGHTGVSCAVGEQAISRQAGRQEARQARFVNEPFLYLGRLK